MNLILLSSDLVTQSKVAGAAQALGLTSVVASNIRRLMEATEESAIVVLDLATQGYDPIDVVGQLKGLPFAPKAILAFGPHVHEARLQSAVDAGCDAVFPRGQFFGQTEDILRQYLGSNPKYEARNPKQIRSTND